MCLGEMLEHFHTLSQMYDTMHTEKQIFTHTSKLYTNNIKRN